MIGGSAEDLIRTLTEETEKLRKEVAQLLEDVKDFERLALVWKKSYQELEFNYAIQLGNKDQIIEELEGELEDLKSSLEQQDR